MRASSRLSTASVSTLRADRHWAWWARAAAAKASRRNRSYGSNRRRAKLSGGEILWQRQDGGAQTDLVKLDQDGKEIREIRGAEIAMIFQEPMSSFSMVHTVGQQIMEAVQLHQDVNGVEAREIAVEMLSSVGIPDPVAAG